MPEWKTDKPPRRQIGQDVKLCRLCAQMKPAYQPVCKACHDDHEAFLKLYEEIIRTYPKMRDFTPLEVFQRLWRNVRRARVDSTSRKPG